MAHNRSERLALLCGLKLLLTQHLIEASFYFLRVVVEEESDGWLPNHVELLNLDRDILTVDLVGLWKAFGIALVF